MHAIIRTLLAGGGGDDDDDDDDVFVHVRMF